MFQCNEQLLYSQLFYILKIITINKKFNHFYPAFGNDLLSPSLIISTENSNFYFFFIFIFMF